MTCKGLNPLHLNHGAQMFCNGCEQLVWRELRFDKTFSYTQFFCPSHCVSIRQTADDNHRNFPRRGVLSKPHQKRQPVYRGNHHVQHNQIRRGLLD